MKQFKQCKCGFFNDKQGEFCHNCGALMVTAPSTDNRPVYRAMALLAFLIDFSVSFYLAYTRGSVLYFFTVFIFLGVALGIGGVFILGSLIAFIRNFTLRSRYNNLVNDITGEKGERSYLLRDERNINRQLRKLLDFKGNLEKNIRMINEAGRPEKLQETCDKATEALGIIQPKINFYKLKLWEFDLIRWINTLKPIVASWDEFDTKQETGEAMEYLRQKREEGAALRRNWQSQPELLRTPQGGNNLKTLDETLKACDSLYHEILGKNTAYTIEDITFGEQPNTPAIKRSLDQIYDVLALADIQEFLDEFSKQDAKIQSELERLEIE